MIHTTADVSFIPNATRDAFCVCGASYKQLQLSERWRALAREVGPALDRDCPDGWVPLNCPACEHRQLGIDARASERPLAPRSLPRSSPASDRARDAWYERAEREGMAL